MKLVNHTLTKYFLLLLLVVVLASCATKPKAFERKFPPCLEKNDVRCKKK